MTTAAILTIGDEILNGRIVDTNAALLSAKLPALGIRPVLHVTCADDVDEICRYLAVCLERADLVVTTGGLGPTEDDVTHRAVASFLGVSLELREAELRRIRERFAAMGLEMPATNMRQAELPKGGRVIRNDHGTAPGCLSEKEGKLVVSLPGVPRELEPMLEGPVVELLNERLSLNGFVRTRVLKTFGHTESKLGEIVEKLPRPWPSLHVGFRPVFPEIHLLLTSSGDTEEDALGPLRAFEERVREAIPRQLWGADDDTFTAVIGTILRERGLRVASVESCTGGLIAKMFTDVAGSSDYFERGFVTYTNEAKQQMVGVSAEIFEPGGPGAVSERCAVEMARGARDRAGVDVAISTTGIAGPGGETATKPVGTVWIGLATPEGVTARRFRFPGNREWVRTLTAYVALERLRRSLLKLPEGARWSVS